MRQGLATFQVVGTRLGRAAQLLLLAQGYARADKTEAGLAALDEALTWMDQTGVCMLEAEAHRLRGELLLAGRSPGTETRTCRRLSRRGVFPPRDRRGPAAGGSVVGVTRHGQPVPAAQGAKGSAGYDCAEALQTLAEIYGRFTEGFDTPDLREARALLAEASQGQRVIAGS